MDIFKNLSIEWYSIIISICSFLAAVYAIVYTHLSNRLRLHISDCYYDRRKSDPYIAHFTLNNLSNKPVTVVNLEFSNVHSLKTIKPLLGFEPTQTYSKVGFGEYADIIDSYWHESTLNEILILQPNSEKEFSYYFNPFQSEMVIKVTLENKRLITRKYIQKSFIVNMKRAN